MTTDEDQIPAWMASVAGIEALRLTPRVRLKLELRIE